MFKRAEQIEVAWSKVGVIWRMLEDFPLEISQRLICLVGVLILFTIGCRSSHFSAEHFPDDEAVEREVTAWYRQQPKEFYAAGFQGLVKLWDRYLNA
jgi:hypothetical protein